MLAIKSFSLSLSCIRFQKLVFLSHSDSTFRDDLHCCKTCLSYFAWLIFHFIQQGRRKWLFVFYSFADLSKATNKTNYMQCGFQNPYFHSKLSSGALVGVVDSYLNSKIYDAIVPNLRMDCTVRFHIHVGYRNRALISKLFVEFSICTRRRKRPFYEVEHLQLQDEFDFRKFSGAGILVAWVFIILIR